MKTRKNKTMVRIKKTGNLPVVLLAGALAGLAGAFFKWGWEVPFPPRAADRISPPAVLLSILQGDSNNYIGSNGISANAVMTLHAIFSIVSGLVYAFVSIYWPKVRMLCGAAFGIFVFVAFHEIIMPLMHLTPAAWDLPFNEQMSELFGHIFWGICLELIFADLVRRFNRFLKSENLIY